VFWKTEAGITLGEYRVCVFIVLEATRMGVGMIMDGKQIDVDKLANMFTGMQ
jgi:hypothetical protein